MDASAYRMVVFTEQDYVMAAATADRLVAAWLQETRGYAVGAPHDGRAELAPHVTLDRDSGSGRHGAHTRWRLREGEDPSRATWQSTLIVRTDVGDPGRTWIQLDAEHRPDSPEVPQARAAKPVLADMLLDALGRRTCGSAAAARSRRGCTSTTTPPVPGASTSAASGRT